MNQNIKNLEARNRIFTAGVEKLSLIELLSLALKPDKDTDVDAMKNLIDNAGGFHKLFYLPPEWFIGQGISRQKAIQFTSMCELAKRYWQTPQENTEIVFDSADAVARYYTNSMKGLEQEEIRVAFLDHKKRLKSEIMVSRGTHNRSIAPKSVIFKTAIERDAKSIIIVHNHPGGDPNPSRDDEMITHMIRDGGKLIGIPLDDHVIIGDKRYYSFREWGKFDN